MQNQPGWDRVSAVSGIRVDGAIVSCLTKPYLCCRYVSLTVSLFLCFFWLLGILLTSIHHPTQICNSCLVPTWAGAQCMICFNILMDSSAQKQLHVTCQWLGEQNNHEITLQKNGTHLGSFGHLDAFGVFSINLKTSAFHHTTHVKVAAGAPEVNFLALALTGKQARLIGRTWGTNPDDGKLQFKLQWKTMLL